MADVSRDVFWRTPFQSLCHPKQMQEFIVMQCDPIREKDRHKVAGHGHISQKVCVDFMSFTQKVLLLVLQSV